MLSRAPYSKLVTESTVGATLFDLLRKNVYSDNGGKVITKKSLGISLLNFVLDRSDRMGIFFFSDFCCGLILKHLFP